jgi:two-component system cell cycle sensor histidine kinase/response regulator CckA
LGKHARLTSREGRPNQGSCLIIAEDITARKRDEENLREQESKLRQAQKMEAIGLLAGGIAHDFNNLLTIILGYTQQILASAGKRSRLKEDAEEVRKAASHAADLVAQLLTFARKHPGSVESLDLNAIVTDTVRLLRRLIGSNIKLETILAEGAGLISADRRNIEQILMNLVTNARDAMPQGGKITIETVNVDISQNGAVPIGDASPGRYVGLYVRDTGQGMDEETAARIFEPFFTTKEGGKGTGLGLSTVYGVVKQSGGHIQVASKPGQGTSFKILFPRFEVEISAPHAIGPIVEGLGGVETVLVAEDDDSVRGLVVQVLRSEGYRVLYARDGFKAMELAGPEGGKVDLLLTDVMMPGIRGPELARILLGRNPRIKVLFMSGYEQGSEDRPVGGELGFLAKPFSPEELAQKVRDLLDRPPAPTGTP